VKSIEKILVFRQSSLGDVILTLPVVAELKAKFPGSTIDFLTKKHYGSVVEYHPAVDRVMLFENNADFKEILGNIRSEKYDLFIDLQRNFRSLAISLYLFGTRRIAYKKRRLAREIIVRKPSLNLKVDHTINAYFHTLRRLGIDSPPSPPQMRLPEEAVKFADRFLGESFNGIPPHLIALCPGARHIEKKWPFENYQAVAKILLRDPSVAILLIYSSAGLLPENPGKPDPRIIRVKDFHVLEVAALLSRCRAALTNDSGLMHLANAVGTKVAAIFGPTSPRLGFSPALPGSTIITRNVFCSPCSLHGEKPCRQPSKYCFEDLDPGMVAASLVKMAESL
jgi:heptosyltransferase-2